ncbi:MAG: hypothetical protein AAGI69_09600 [Cyanobacteria bacterium P01_H01_bin.21]
MVRFLRFKHGVLLLGTVLLGSCAGVSGPAEVQESGTAADIASGLVQESESPDISIAEAEITPETNPSRTAQAPESLAVSDPGILFSCYTAEDKLIALYDQGSIIQYVFGPEEQPELVLDVPREAASTYQWQGIGRYESYSVSIPNQNTVYHVSWARDRLEIDQPAEAGVSVDINGEYVTTVDCATDIIHNLIGVDLPPTQL